MKTFPESVAESARLFWEMEQHLMVDETPSGYLAAIAHAPALNQHPFCLIKPLQTTRQSPEHHPEGSVWNHTLLVVDEAARRKEDSADPRVFMWAALLHDIGKPPATRIRKGRITAYDHDKIGAALAEEFLSVLLQEPPFIARVCGLIRFHMQILYVVKRLPYADIPGMKESVNIDDLALLGLCDRLGRKGADKAEEEETIKSFINHVTSTERYR